MSATSAQPHFHAAANAAASRCLQLADHYAACRDFQFATADEIAQLPIGKNGKPKGAHKISDAGFPPISAEDILKAEAAARAARRYAVLAGRFNIDNAQIATMADRMRAFVIYAKSIAPEAADAFVPSVLEPHGHGRDLKTKANRESGDAQERIRHNDREIEDNNNKGNDYAADNARIGGRLSVQGIVSAALSTAREDADWR